MSGEEDGVYISVLEEEWDALEAENKRLREALKELRQEAMEECNVHSEFIIDVCDGVLKGEE